MYQLSFVAGAKLFLSVIYTVYFDSTVKSDRFFGTPTVNNYNNMCYRMDSLSNYYTNPRLPVKTGFIYHLSNHLQTPAVRKLCKHSPIKAK